MKRIYLLLILIAVSAYTFPIKHDVSDHRIVKIVPSDEYIAIPFTNNRILSLPKYETYFFQPVPLIQSLENKLDLGGDFSYDAYCKEMAIREEKEKLSEKLGIETISDDYLDFYREVSTWLGTRYRMGSMSRKAVDCSGFTNIIYNKVFHKEIPRVSTAIANNLSEELPVDQLAPGDLVFFITRGRKRINHVGMYLGEGQFVHASIKGVKVSDLNDGYYKRTFCKAGKIG